MSLVTRLARRAADTRLPALDLDRLSPIGLDVGGRWVKAVQWRRSGRPGRPRLRVAAAVRFLRQGLPDHAPPPPTLAPLEAARAADILHRAGFRGHAVVVPLPAHAQVSGPVRLPARASAAPLDQIALAQLADLARLPPDALVAAWWESSPRSPSTLNPHAASPSPAPAPPDHTLGFALGGRRKDLDALLDAFLGSGLEPVAVDARPCALVRAAAPLLRRHRDRPGDDGLSATIDIGSASGTLGVAHLGRLVYERTLPEFGTAALRASLAHHLDLEPDVADFLLTRIGLGPPPPDCPEQSAEVIDSARDLIAHHVAAMARELQSSLAYARNAVAGPRPSGPDPDHAASPPPVFLVGGGALIPGLPERISQEMNGPARAVHLADLADEPLPDHLPLDARTSSMIVAAGLALNDPRALALEAAA